MRTVCHVVSFFESSADMRRITGGPWRSPLYSR
jgi:hypothetical protein